MDIQSALFVIVVLLVVIVIALAILNNNVVKIATEMQVKSNRCPHGFENWDECPVCGH